MIGKLVLIDKAIITMLHYTKYFERDDLNDSIYEQQFKTQIQTRALVTM